jgi:hypothetical protein
MDLGEGNAHSTARNNERVASISHNGDHLVPKPAEEGSNAPSTSRPAGQADFLSVYVGPITYKYLSIVLSERPGL